MSQRETLDRILNSVGLERQRSAMDFLLPAAGLVATGVLVGAGLGLMFAPKRGTELRQGLRRRVASVLPGRASSFAGNGKPLEDMSREELYELAREQEVEGRSNMSKRELVETLSH